MPRSQFKNGYEFRDYARGAVVEVSRAFGRVEDRVTCPFCGAQVYTFRWSRWGNGKKCGCGAILSGTMARRKDQRLQPPSE